MSITKTRVLFLVSSFLPKIGGVERHTYYVAKELSKRGIEITIITRSFSQLNERDRINSISVRHVNIRQRGPLKILPIWLYLLRNFRILICNDIIHLHDWSTFLWILPLFPVLKILRRPVFITFHGFERYPIPRLAYLFRRLAEKVAWGNICVGAFIAKWYGTKPDIIIVGGVEKPKYLPLENVIKKSNEIVFIGRLSNDTGVIELLDAVRILRDKYHYNIELHVCGDGPLNEYVRRFANLNNLNVHMHGFVPNPWNYIVKAGIVFAPGYLSILESMVARRLVIGIYNNPLKKDYFFSIPKISEMMILASNSEELAEKLYEVLTGKKSVNEILDKAYIFAEKQTWKRVTLAYLILYKNKIKDKVKCRA